LGGAISWFVGRMLERLITSDAEELGLRHTPNPQPSPDAFHNRLAEPFTITNPRYHISSAYSDRGNCYVDVGDHVRTSRSSRRDPYGDLNMPEMLCSRDEFEGLLIPAGKRSSASPTDGQFVAACRKLGRNPDELQLQYVRPFLVVGSAAGKIPVQAQVSSQAQYGGKARVQTVVGFGVTKQNGGQRQLLVVG
jgi:hypothetical protein